MTLENTKRHFHRHHRKYAFGATLWGAASGAYGIIGALSGHINPFALAIAATCLGGALALGKFLHRPGADT